MPNSSPPSTRLAPQPRSNYRWWALLVLALAQFLVILDATIVNIALPSIGADLHLDTAALSWVITAYVLPFGGLLLFGGRLADRFGHRRLFLIGVAGFGAASVMAGLSSSGEMLLVARAIQGASAAVLAPAALALLTQLFSTPGDRAKALGIWGGVAGIGSVAGVLLGGVLTATFGWAAVFFVNLPVALIVLIAIPLLVDRDRASLGARLDVPGAITVTSGLVALVGGFTQAQRLGFGHPVPLALFAAAAVLIAAFVVIESRTAAPLLPLGVFRNRATATGNLVVFLVGAAMIGLFFAIAVFLQEVLGYDALAAGLASLPMAGVIVVVAGLAPTLIHRFGVRTTLVGGLLVLVGGLVWLSMAPSDAEFVADLLAPTLLIGAGLGAALVASTDLAVTATGEGESGLASALVNTSQQVGGVLGLAVLATVAASRTQAVESAGGSLPVAMTAGFSWVFLGAAAFTFAAAAVALIMTPRAAVAAPEVALA